MVSVVSTLPGSASVTSEVLPPWGDIEFRFAATPSPAGVDIRIYDSTNTLIERITQITNWNWGINDPTKNLNGTAYFLDSGSLAIDPTSRLVSGQSYTVKILAGSFSDLTQDIVCRSRWPLATPHSWSPGYH